MKAGNTVTVRPAHAHDLAAVMPLARAIHEYHRENRPDYFPPFDEGGYRHQFLAAVCRNDAKIFLAEQDTLLGYCSAILRQRRQDGQKTIRALTVEELFVLPACRGNGIGTALFQQTLDWGKSLGASAAELTVWGFNEAAGRFYRRFGMSTRSAVLEMQLER